MRILDCSIFRTDVRLRMPFRYGIATMTDGPVLFLRLTVEIGGKTSIGTASDLLPPKWFTKIPTKPIAEEVAEMLAVIRHAADKSIGLAGETAFDLVQTLSAIQTGWASDRAIPPLLANFGVSLVERALIEAVARARGETFAQMLASNALGIRLGEIHPELGQAAARTYLPEKPLTDLLARYTVGLSDPLTEEEISDADRLNDGLPQSLEASIRAYGLLHFKIKVNGDVARDVERLVRVADVMGRTVRPGFAFSLDGNEQFKSMEAFREFWSIAGERAELKHFFQHLLFIEQPLHRDVALASEVGVVLRSWKGHPPVIIDESDATTNDLRVALELGYAGTSHKNCKGVFKGIAHRCLIESRRAKGEARLMSGEDLCNIGPVALMQDLAVMAALGIESVERNGHHYHAGLSQFPEPVRAVVLGAHPDLYDRSSAGWPTLKVNDGRIALGTINQAPFGVGFILEPRWFS